MWSVTSCTLPQYSTHMHFHTHALRSTSCFVVVLSTVSFSSPLFPLSWFVRVGLQLTSYCSSLSLWHPTPRAVQARPHHSKTDAHEWIYQPQTRTLHVRLLLKMNQLIDPLNLNLSVSERYSPL